MTKAVYNEIDPYCCKVLRARIADGSLPPGDVDDRDIREVSADDYKGYGQIHLFAGIGGFGYAARLAGLPDGVDILTGGFPCQPWSVAGRRGGASDDRHLWPEMLRLIREVRPQRVIGENVPGLDDAEYMALDGVLSDLEGAGYEGWPIEVPACGVDAPHVRNRLWIISYPKICGLQGVEQTQRSGKSTRKGVRTQSGGVCGDVPNTNGEPMGRTTKPREEHCQWITEPAVDRVADGIPNRMDRIKSLGNAVVPQVAAEIMHAMGESL